MAVILFDYNKCKGSGVCVRECPMDLLEVTQDGRWCKPKDEEVDNTDSVEEFYEMIGGKSDLKIITFELENCAECYSCETSCPEEAIEVKE